MGRGPGSLRVTLWEGGAQLRLWEGAGKWRDGAGCTWHCTREKCLARLRNSPAEKSWTLPLDRMN